MSNIFNIAFEFLKEIVLPVSRTGMKPVYLGKENLNIPEWCVFELKLLVDLVFYGYIAFAVSSHFIKPEYVWFYFGDYLFGVCYFIGLAILFNFLIRLYRKKKHLNS